MIGPRELSAEGQEHWHAFIQFNAQRTDRWRNEFEDELNNMWIRPLETQANESIPQARRNYLRYCSKEGKPCYQKYIDKHELAQRLISKELVNEEDAEVFALQPPAKKPKTSEIVRDRIIAGTKPQQLYKEFPGCIPLIKQ